MVRLLQDKAMRSMPTNIFFQSHNGAIAAALAWLRQMGITAFNPTMVRLLIGSDALGDRRPDFQSHNGAIAEGSGDSRRRVD